MADNTLEVKRRLYLLLKDVNLVNEYLRRFGHQISAKNINDIKYSGKGGKSALAGAKETDAARDDDAPAAAETPADEGAKGEDPIYETFVNCPACGRARIRCYELRPKSQQVVQTVFLVPVYSGTAGYATVDYSRLAVNVCPDCLFASPDRKNFNYPSVTGKGEEKSTLQINVLASLKDSCGERRTLLPLAVGHEDYFRRPRPASVAIESYNLAMARAKAEAELMQPYAHYKIGSYLLKIAYIQKQEGGDDTETMKEARKYFEKSFQRSECPSEEIEMQVIYTVAALNIRLGDLNQANQYLNVYGKLLNERNEQKKKNPALTTQWIEKWLDKTRYIWEERENPGYFDSLSISRI